MKDAKKKALAEYLQEPIEDITSGDGKYTTGGADYLVLTDDEAEERAREYIRESLWAFTEDFIIQHSKALDYDEPSRQIIRAIQNECENGNEAVFKLIDDFEEFAEDAISTDGRGHFIATYDGHEREEGEYFIYRV